MNYILLKLLSGSFWGEQICKILTGETVAWHPTVLRIVNCIDEMKIVTIVNHISVLAKGSATNWKVGGRGVHEPPSSVWGAPVLLASDFFVVNPNLFSIRNVS